MYEAVCRRRGLILKGGEPDYERGANALLDDLEAYRGKAVDVQKLRYDLKEDDK